VCVLYWVVLRKRAAYCGAGGHSRLGIQKVLCGVIWQSKIVYIYSFIGKALMELSVYFKYLVGEGSGGFAGLRL
jgi:hypothetical protein